VLHSPVCYVVFFIIIRNPEISKSRRTTVIHLDADMKGNGQNPPQPNGQRQDGDSIEC
jgi:hypothetical protein